MQIKSSYWWPQSIFIYFLVLVALQVSMSTQSPRRQIRQADDYDMNFPDENPDTDNRWGQSNGGRPNRPQVQPNRPNRPNRPGNNNGGRPEQQQQVPTRYVVNVVMIPGQIKTRFLHVLRWRRDNSCLAPPFCSSNPPMFLIHIHMCNRKTYAKV